MSTPRRRYYCPIEVTVDVIGGRWTAIILGHLKEGTHRYGELRRKIPQLSEKMLTQRLRELEQHGLVERRVHEGVPAPVSYHLTELGVSLSPVLQALYDWGLCHAEAHDIEIAAPVG